MCYDEGLTKTNKCHDKRANKINRPNHYDERVNKTKTYYDERRKIK